MGLQNNEVIEESDFNLFNQDSLKANWTNKYEIVVGNPPYVKYQDLSDENRQYLANKWQTIEYGTFNLYFAFFELGYKLLASNGKLGYITPNNYFTSLAGLSLRQYFLKTKCLTRIVDFRHKKYLMPKHTLQSHLLVKRRMSQFCLIKLEIIKLVKNF